MTTATLLMGKRGEGKGLSAVAMMRKYLRDGRMVATNMDIRPWLMVGPLSSTRAYRVPDFPTAEALATLPLGNPSLEYGEDGLPRIRAGASFSDDNNGLLVLDETSTFLNARKWQGAERQDLLDWLAHSRKFGWDLLLIAQGASQIDKQVRDSLCELFGTVRNLGKLQMPIVSAISKSLIGVPVKMPEIRVMVVRYGWERGAALAERVWFKGKDCYPLYDTLQVINGDTGQQGVSAYLTGWEARGRYMNPMALHRGVAVVGMVLGLSAGLAVGWWLGAREPKAASVVSDVVNDVTVTGVASSGNGVFQVLLSDGRVARSMRTDATMDGIFYEIEGKRYRVTRP